MTGSLLRCDGLVKVFPLDGGEVVALQGLDLSVEPGESVGVVGVSGSGKSTMLAVVSGIVAPTAGQVVFDGSDLGRLTTRQLDRYRRIELGFLWQNPATGLVPYLNSRQNVALALELEGDGDAGDRADELLDEVGLGSRKDHRLSALSGGEVQRVALAAALVHRPRLLLADEPTGQLDRASTTEILAMMRSLGRAWGLSQLIVSHDRELVDHVDRVVAIRDGRTAAEQRKREDDGEPEEVLVVDNVGRLQLPADQREEVGIDGKAVAEVVDGAIVLRPTTGPNRPGTGS